ncbi:18515_t:CDS:2 [Acaulospora morrowiae]|uniref:18515_t:CDS:1 n=1 Tax=Acaulospora morrowiae TaxID=94023 RepID=A0A9N8ZRG4_9GLOM|nr:18515_t:CDS:2 [Acaulospora morrowiae]
MKYVATASLEDSSVCVWKFPDKKNGEYELKFSHSLDLKKIDLMEPIRVSDSKDVLIGSCCKNSLILEIRDSGNTPIKILNAQEDLKGKIECSRFLKNGELVIVEGDPVYQERVLILLDVPFVIMQWNLVTRKFEAQYELNWNLTISWESIGMVLNKNCKLLAKGELLLVYFEEEHSFYAINLSTYSKSKNPRKVVLSAQNDFMVPNFIIQRSHDRLQIESLSRNLELEDDIQSEPGKDEKIDLCYGEEIKDIISDILKTRQPNQSMTQGLIAGSYGDWRVEYEKINNDFVARLTAKQSNTEEVIGKEATRYNNRSGDKERSIRSGNKEGSRYYEVSVDELAKYVKKIENVDESQPLLPAIKEIVGYEKKADEKFPIFDEILKNINNTNTLVKLINQEKERLKVNK